MQFKKAFANYAQQAFTPYYLQSYSLISSCWFHSLSSNFLIQLFLIKYANHIARVKHSPPDPIDCLKNEKSKEFAFLFINCSLKKNAHLY